MEKGDFEQKIGKIESKKSGEKNKKSMLDFIRSFIYNADKGGKKATKFFGFVACISFTNRAFAILTESMACLKMQLFILREREYNLYKKIELILIFKMVYDEVVPSIRPCFFLLNP